MRYFATAGVALVASAVARLRAGYPGVQIDLKLTADSEDPQAAVREGRADLALLVQGAGGAGSSGLRVVPLLDDPYLAVLPRGHRLAGRRSLRLRELAAEAFVGSEWPGPCLDAQLDACAAVGFRPRFVVESEDYVTAQGVCRRGAGREPGAPAGAGEPASGGGGAGGA